MSLFLEKWNGFRTRPIYRTLTEDHRPVYRTGNFRCCLKMHFSSFCEKYALVCSFSPLAKFITPNYVKINKFRCNGKMLTARGMIFVEIAI